MNYNNLLESVRNAAALRLRLRCFRPILERRAGAWCCDFTLTAGMPASPSRHSRIARAHA